MIRFDAQLFTTVLYSGETRYRSDRRVRAVGVSLMEEEEKKGDETEEIQGTRSLDEVNIVIFKSADKYFHLVCYYLR